MGSAAGNISLYSLARIEAARLRSSLWIRLNSTSLSAALNAYDSSADWLGECVATDRLRSQNFAPLHDKSPDRPNRYDVPNVIDYDD